MSDLKKPKNRFSFHGDFKYGRMTHALQTCSKCHRFQRGAAA